MANCFFCGKKFGFREKSYNLEQVEEWCRFYEAPHLYPQILAQTDWWSSTNTLIVQELFLKFMPHEPIHDNQHIMQNKDKICEVCWQSHNLVYHIIPYYEQIKAENKQDLIPAAIERVNGTETFADIYSGAIDNVQTKLDADAWKECIWCKKQFEEQIPRIMDSIKKNEDIHVSLNDSNNKVGACGECKKIISEFNSEKLKELRKEITLERNKLDRINSLIKIRRSSHSSAQLGEFINIGFSLLGSAGNQLQSETSSQTEETANRLLKEVEAERDEIESNIELLENEINQELVRLSEEHFFQKKSTSTETKLTADVIEKNFCIHCGTQLVPNAKFCGKCGNSI